MRKYPRDLLLLATPRSGTRFIVKVLRNAHFKIGHEGMKQQGTCGMFFAVEDRWYPGQHAADDWGYFDEDHGIRSAYEFKQVWHMTRDPRKVIPSLAAHYFPGHIWCWQERHTGISCGHYPKMHRAMLFWLAWNEIIERNEQIDFFFRVEQTREIIGEICGRLGLDPGYKIPDAIPKDYGSAERGPRRPQPLNWPLMEQYDPELTKLIRDKAARYGYDVDAVLPEVPVEVNV